MIEIAGAGLRLRPLGRRDRAEWDELRRINADWLRPWEASNPDPGATLPTFAEYVRAQAAATRRGESFGWAITAGRAMIGHVTLSQVARASLQSATIGYWVGHAHAGHGVAPRAVALVCDYAFFTLALHRVEINIRPENAASLRVVAKLGFRDEGIRRRYLHIQGDWRDHRTFALTAEEAPHGVLARLTHEPPS
ncbi:GNAT family N-acetyltransferase [Pseudactinotalea sp. HY160]|uniref:GNAT family N-acetyltransferase n=1 Tax=Pseudactinotalea sp. HY160 TaxID=2654490 RepID=UPI0013113915|nr:GNAT family N-acetyltransferase [Pseudactinotalea sp. HY160]